MTTIFIIVGAVALALIGVALFDLSRHEVRSLPKWAWALIIVLVNVPLGIIIYWIAGRVPAGEIPSEGADPARAGVPHSATASRLVEPGRTVTATPASGPEVITTRSLTKRYGDTFALDSVDLHVPTGATYGLIGPNGAGKTTMLSIIAGLRHPTSGELELAVDRRRMGLLVDTPLFEPWLTAREVIDLARHLTAPDIEVSRGEEVLVQVGLGDAMDRRTGGFSRGMLQRLGLAGCLVGDPEVLVLDEPSSALDPAGRREVLDLVGRLAHTKTVILSTHILADVQQVCDTVGVIDQGRLLFQGPLADLLARTSASYLLHVRPPTSGLAETLAARPWVTDATEVAPGRFRIVVSDGARAEAEIPAILGAAGHPLVSFNPATDLETAFLELTR
ncbi:MAG: ATP-binding cassette domain-containing protein [Acidimicrobiales bacterium]